MPRTRTRIPQVVTPKQLREREFGPLPWLWDGYLAAGSISLLTSPWKTGKTTLISVLLSRMGTGGELAGSVIKSGRALIVTEEDERLWARRSEKLSIGANIGWLVRPFSGPPTMREWSSLMHQTLREHRSEPLALLVIDPLASLFPNFAENNGRALLQALSPIRKLAARGTAVLLVHHPRKNRTSDAIVPRGSGVLPATVDVLMELSRPNGTPAGDRRRWLRAVSRYEETAPERLIELNSAGTDYTLINEPDAGAFVVGWPILTMVFEDANHRLTRRDVLNSWPGDYDKPHPTTLWRWLERALSEGLILRKGSGRCSDPFLYWLPGRERFLMRDLPPLAPVEWSPEKWETVLKADQLAGEYLEEYGRSKRKRREREEGGE